MAILGLQGIRGGVGTTSIAAALAWSLQLLGKTYWLLIPAPIICCACHSTSISAIATAGPERCLMVVTGGKGDALYLAT